MTSTVRHAVLIVLLGLSVSCDGSAPGSPTEVGLSYPVSDFTKQSHFVLYDNGAFELRYAHITNGSYHGTYQEDTGVVSFSSLGATGSADALIIGRR